MPSNPFGIFFMTWNKEMSKHFSNPKQYCSFLIKIWNVLLDNEYEEVAKNKIMIYLMEIKINDVKPMQYLMDNRTKIIDFYFKEKDKKQKKFYDEEKPKVQNTNLTFYKPSGYVIEQIDNEMEKE